MLTPICAPQVTSHTRKRLKHCKIQASKWQRSRGVAKDASRCKFAVVLSSTEGFRQNRSESEDSYDRDLSLQPKSFAHSTHLCSFKRFRTTRPRPGLKRPGARWPHMRGLGEHVLPWVPGSATFRGGSADQLALQGLSVLSSIF